MPNLVFKPEDVLLVDMGLINRCNLACPLCPYVVNNIKQYPKEEVVLEEYISFLDKLPNLEVAIIEGNYCEPTLYSRLPELISYFSSRGVKIRLSTNGNTRTEKYWADLGTRFGAEDIVRFAIDGSTQELHSTYRINGSIDKVLKFQDALKSISFKGKSVLQNIVFQYNVEDRDNMIALYESSTFDYISFIKCYNTGSNHDKDFKFRPVDAVNDYNILYGKIHKSLGREASILCDAFNRKEVYVNHQGKVFLCGSLDEGNAYTDTPHITDNLDAIFDKISYMANNIHGCGTCLADCNTFCYNLGEKFPDILIGTEGSRTEVNYFTKELYNEEGNICHQLI